MQGENKEKGTTKRSLVDRLKYPITVALFLGGSGLIVDNMLKHQELPFLDYVASRARRAVDFVYELPKKSPYILLAQDQFDFLLRSYIASSQQVEVERSSKEKLLGRNRMLIETLNSLRAEVDRLKPDEIRIELDYLQSEVARLQDEVRRINPNRNGDNNPYKRGR